MSGGTASPGGHLVLPHRSYQLFLRKELSENGYDKMSDGG